MKDNKGIIIVTVAVAAIIGTLVWAFVATTKADSAYNEQHPQVCIAQSKLVNSVAHREDAKVVDYTLTFADGKVLQRSQIQGNQKIQLGSTYCTAWARR